MPEFRLRKTRELYGELNRDPIPALNAKLRELEALAVRGRLALMTADVPAPAGVLTLKTIREYSGE